MESSDSLDITTELRRAIRQLRSQADHELELKSLLAMINDDPELTRIAESELAPRNGHLELHLDGSSVKEHATVAKAFAQFISRMADAAKAAVRDLAGVASLPDELLVNAGAGSVRVTFIAPPRAETDSTLAVPELVSRAVDSLQ